MGSATSTTYQSKHLPSFCFLRKRPNVCSLVQASPQSISLFQLGTTMRCFQENTPNSIHLHHIEKLYFPQEERANRESLYNWSSSKGMDVGAKNEFNDKKLIPFNLCDKQFFLATKVPPRRYALSATQQKTQSGRESHSYSWGPTQLQSFEFWTNYFT